MIKEILILIILLPLMNFIHEGGHWLGARSLGIEPKMLLQRVDVGDETNHSLAQKTFYNWAGPFTNYSIFAMALFYPVMTPVAFLMAVHKLAPNLFALHLYLKGKTGFSTDETKQFSENKRIYVASFFLFIYSLIASYFLMRWLPELSFLFKGLMVVSFIICWLTYLFFLDFLDKKLTS